MPLPADYIKNYSQSELRQRAHQEILGERRPIEKSWVSPRYGDGGWHSTPGLIDFDPRLIEPLDNHVLIELECEPEKEGLISKPENARDLDRSNRIGTVLRVGPGKWNKRRTHRMPMELKVGDRVLMGTFSDWESWDAAYPGNNIVLCQEADIRLVIT
jgi:chaperonin GroES